jgi:hypothetical protein
MNINLIRDTVTLSPTLFGSRDQIDAGQGWMTGRKEVHTMRTISPIRLFFALCLLSVSAASLAQIGISVSFGPPPLPVYEQPICPAEGYIWTPGYWAWDGDVGQEKVLLEFSERAP